MQFTPNEDFLSDETKSQYLKGMTYTVRPGNEALSKLVMKWIKDGKVSAGAAPFNAASPGVLGAPGKVTGKGKVE